MALTFLILLLVTIKSSMSYSVVSQYPKVERSLDSFPEISDNEISENTLDGVSDTVPYPEEEFDGVYSECVLQLSFLCVQNKTLNYLKRLNEKNEISVYGNFLKFVKTKDNLPAENDTKVYYLPSNPADEIDKKIEEFFGTHVLRVQIGKEFKEDLDLDKILQTSEGRKKNKEDKNHKKMMMMAMMMMKMKMMMMMPAMMGMTGIIAFKALILGAISLLISKILLLMKLMGGGGGKMGSQGGGHGGADVTVWMPSGGSGGGMGGWDSHNSGGGGGGGGGGYNANGEWQNRAGWDSPQILRGVRADRKKRNIIDDGNDKHNALASEKSLKGLLESVARNVNRISFDKISNIKSREKKLHSKVFENIKNLPLNLD